MTFFLGAGSEKLSHFELKSYTFKVKSISIPTFKVGTIIRPTFITGRLNHGIIEYTHGINQSSNQDKSFILTLE